MNKGPAHEYMITPVDCERMLLQAMDRLDNETHEYMEVQQRAAEAEALYRRAKGYKYLAVRKAGLTIRDAESRVDIELHDERLAYLAADAMRHGARESLVSLRVRIESLRTLSASVRAQT
jgi:hypothetical protein